MLLLTTLVTRFTNRYVPIEQRRSRWSLALYAVYLALIAVLAASSFGSILRWGHMSGYALLTHMAAAGAFVFLLMLIAWLYLPHGRAVRRLETRWWLARWSAWTMVLASLVVIASMLLCMLPLLDTVDMRRMIDVHRYAGLAVVATAAMHAASLCYTRLGWR